MGWCSGTDFSKRGGPPALGGPSGGSPSSWGSLRGVPQLSGVPQGVPQLLGVPQGGPPERFNVFLADAVVGFSKMKVMQRFPQEGGSPSKWCSGSLGDPPNLYTSDGNERNWNRVIFFQTKNFFSTKNGLKFWKGLKTQILKEKILGPREHVFFDFWSQKKKILSDFFSKLCNSMRSSGNPRDDFAKSISILSKIEVRISFYIVQSQKNLRTNVSKWKSWHRKKWYCSNRCPSTRSSRNPRDDFDNSVLNPFKIGNKDRATDSRELLGYQY